MYVGVCGGVLFCLRCLEMLVSVTDECFEIWVKHITFNPKCKFSML